jgi:hypothetical protein
MVVNAMQVSFWEYTWASSVGVLPGMAFFIYLGSLAHNLLDIGSKQPALNSPAAVATIALSGIMITLVAALTGNGSTTLHFVTCTAPAQLSTHVNRKEHGVAVEYGVSACRDVCQEGGCNQAQAAAAAAAIR